MRRSSLRALSQAALDAEIAPPANFVGTFADIAEALGTEPRNIRQSFENLRAAGLVFWETVDDAAVPGTFRFFVGLDELEARLNLSQAPSPRARPLKRSDDR